MPLASKWLDLVVGLDLHLELTPPQVPVPFPHPFVGLVPDAVGFIIGEVIGAAISLAQGMPVASSGPVFVNGMPATVTGDDAKMPTGHIIIPPGTTWVRPPPGDATLLFGSKSVSFRGNNAVRIGDPALPCSDPVRLPSGLVLPTGIPITPVIVGGPPTINWMMLAMMLGMKGLTKAVRNKWTAGLAHGAVERAAKVLKRGELPKNPGRLRRFLHSAACFVTGHPVNVANGSMFTEWSDFELPGPIPLTFNRRYDSGCCDRDSPLGHGWAHSLDQQIWIEPSCVVYLTEDGRELEFDTFDRPDHVMRKGDVIHDPISRLTLRSLGQLRWEVESHDGIVREFGPIAGESAANEDRGLARLTRIRNRQGDEIRLFYDDRARLSELIDSVGRRIQLEYDHQQRLQHLWLPAASGDGMRQHAHFLYSEQGDLIEARDAAGKPVRFEYDRHLMVRETDRNGLSFYFAYDGWGSFARCVRTWGDGGILDHVLRYDRENRTTLVTDSLGEMTAYEMDGLGLVVSITNARGGVTTYEYDECVRKSVVTDPLGNETRYAYDEQGNQTKLRGPDGAVTKARYDEHNDLVWLRTPKGSEWRWTHDRWGRVASRVDPTGHVTRFAYEDRELVAVEDSMGRRTALGYDSQGNVAELTFPDGTTTRARYDALGRAVVVTDAKGNAQRLTYDAQGRLLRVDEPDGNIRVFERDASGNVVRVRDRLLDARFTYFGMDKLASRTVGGTTVRLEYDTEQRLAAVINEKGHAYRFERDPLGDVRAELGFDEVRRLYERDAAGRVTKVYRPGVGGSSTFEHDGDGRITKVEHSDGSSATFEYDEDGDLVRAVNDAATVELRRDALGRVIEERLGDDWVESSYDDRGLRVAMRTSLGLSQAIERNVMGDVIGVVAKQWEQTWSASFRRDPLGLELERVLPGDVRSQWWRDGIGRPTAHRIGKPDVSGGVVRGRRYAWDVDDRLLEIFEEGRGAERFEHDARGYLVSSMHDDGRVDLRMPDEVGNLFQTRDRSDREYGASGELRKVRTPEGTRTYHYDPEGNLQRRVEPDGRVWTYHWNAAGHLARVERPEGDPVCFEYDALGRRVVERCGEYRRRWIWDRNCLVHERWESSEGAAPERGEEPAPSEILGPSRGAPRGPPGAASEPRGDACVTWIFEEDGFAPLARMVEGESHSIVCDHRDVPLSVLDADGNEAWRGYADSRGRMEIVGQPDLCPWRLSGQYYDEATGLCYNRFRYYDPEQGRYISRDPLELLGGLELYAYVPEPLVEIDPLGLMTSRYEVEGTKIKDLLPLDGPGHSAPRPDLMKLSDDELLNAVHNPLNRDPLLRNTRTGRLSQGNGRARELQRRAADPNSKISPDDVVPVQNYTPDNSMFWDLD